MDIGGGTIRARPAMRLNRRRGCMPLSFFSLSGPYSLEDLSGSLIVDSLREGNTKEARHSDVQGNPQVVSDNDRIPVLHTHT